MKQHMSRAYPVGWLYWTSVTQRYGHRQIGPEARCVVDDFGNLVMVDSSS